MATPAKEYTNGEITIIWQAEKCIHSTNCWKGLPNVFNPKVRPWINATGASTREISSQVLRCPSGALTHKVNVPKD